VIDRIRTDYHVTCMVALDTFDLIVERVRRLLSYDRKLAMTQRYTYTGDAPRLYAGLEIDTSATGGGINEWSKCDGAGFGVLLRPGLEGFGFAAYASDGNGTEEEAWKRYHAAKAESPNYFERRREMTEIELTGGREQDDPTRDDQIIIRAWNSDGVCDERVIGFDSTEAHR
jgi:hypothetical protein